MNSPSILLFASLALCSLLAAPTPAQLVTDTLIADINADAVVVGSYSGAFAGDGELVYFRGVDLASGEGYRIWRTDGTTPGTEQLATLALDIRESVFAADGNLSMIADALGIGVGLWKSDGTAAGTVEVLPPQPWTVQPHDLTEFDGAIWFLAGTAASGVEVWKSDSATGTTAVAFELGPGAASGAGDLFASDSHLFIGAPGATTLSASDGTPGSLTALATFTFPSSGTFDKAARIGNRVVFNVAGFGASAGWWASDGTPAGTLRIQGSFNDFWAVAAATKVYFTAGEASVPRLWVTDGTSAGTLPVDDATSSGGQRVSFQYPGLPVGDAFYFGGFVDGLGFEPSHTPGAAPDSQLVADVFAGSGDSDPADFVEFGGEIFFRAEDGVTGREIWVHDPVLGTTRPIGDLFPGPFSGVVGASPTLMSAQHGVVFGQNFAQFGMEPAVTDGIQTDLLLNIANDGDSGGSGPRDFLRLGDIVLFQAFDESVGSELWRTDGSAAGTQLVIDIDPTNSGFPGAFGSAPHHMVQFGDRAVFFASHPVFGSELWSSDGTMSGTSRLADLVPGPASSEPLFSAPPVVLGDALYVIAREASGAFALYRSDGTGPGTSKVLTTDPTGFVAEFVTLVTINDRLLFTANLGGGLELWTSDGTAAGTELLVDANPAGSSFFTGLVTGDSVAYFGTSVGSDRTLWRTDGTPAGTEAIFVQRGGAFLAGPADLATFGNSLLFTVDDGVVGREPWISDGSPGGTMLLADIQPGAASSRAVSFTPAGDAVFFAVESPPGSGHFQQVWITDGTTPGTEMVVELPSPIAGAGVADFWAAGSEDSGPGAGTDRLLVFSNIDANGSEWWVTDGTAAGTRAIADIAPGPAFSDPGIGVLVGNTLVFTADDGEAGLELHAFPFVETDGFAVTSLGMGCEGANGNPTLSFAGGAASAGEAFVLDVSEALPSTEVFWAFDLGLAGLPAPGECALQIALPTVLGITTADSLGESLLPLAIPGAASLVGLTVDFQAFSSEPGGPFLGLGALTNTLEIVIGP